MYGNYGPGFNQQMYLNDLQNMRDRIDRQMQQVSQPTQPQTPQINQNFQLAPTQNNGIKYVENVDEVEKELVFSDTLFVNKDFTMLWFKNVAGDIKHYELKEIVVVDEKDQKIAELTEKIAVLEGKVMKDAKHDNSNNDETTSK